MPFANMKYAHLKLEYLRLKICIHNVSKCKENGITKKYLIIHAVTVHLNCKQTDDMSAVKYLENYKRLCT